MYRAVHQLSRQALRAQGVASSSASSPPAAAQATLLIRRAAGTIVSTPHQQHLQTRSIFFSSKIPSERQQQQAPTSAVPNQDAASTGLARAAGTAAGSAISSAALSSNSNTSGSASASNSGSGSSGGSVFSFRNGNGSGNGNGGKKRKRGFFRRVGRFTLWTLIIGSGVTYYYIWQSQNPPDQLPQDPSKKTIVVLGSGWAATSFLKSINTDHWNVVVISPHNYFLFTPLLPSVTVGTLEGRSIAQPTRHFTRFKSRAVQVYEASAEKVDAAAKTVTFEDVSPIHGTLGKVTIPYDYLIYGVGSENQTFGLEGVQKHACFLKELGDAEKIRNKLMDCVESAAIAGTSEEDVKRLLHFVTIGGGPTGVEYAAEIRDFVQGDLKKWYPEVADKVTVTLIEALPNILPSFSKTLVEYTMGNFKEQDIDVKTKHMVKDVDEKFVHVQDPKGEMLKIPYGLLVWAAGNTARPITRDLMSQLSDAQKNRRGLEVDEHMRLKGAEDSVFALGDATATQYAPTAQAASQQGSYLARLFNQLGRVESLEQKLDQVKRQPITDETANQIVALEKQIKKAAKIRPFHYTHQGSLAYIGKDKAIADIPLFGGDFASSGVATYVFWQSAYWSMLFSIRNRALVSIDWLKVSLFGRDVSRE